MTRPHSGGGGQRNQAQPMRALVDNCASITRSFAVLTLKLEGIPRAREHFLAALTADPTLSGAYTGLAWLHIMESGSYGLAPFEDSSRLAAEQARKAVAADPNDPYAHAMLAFA